MSRDLVGENRQRAETLQGLRRAGAKQSPISVRFRVRAHFGGLRFSYLEPFLLKLRVTLWGSPVRGRRPLFVAPLNRSVLCSSTG